MLCVEQTQVPRLKALGLPWKMSAQLCVSNGKAAGPIDLPASRTRHPGEGLLGTSTASFKGQSHCFWEGGRSSGGLGLANAEVIPCWGRLWSLLTPGIAGAPGNLKGSCLFMAVPFCSNAVHPHFILSDANFLPFLITRRKHQHGGRENIHKQVNDCLFSFCKSQHSEEKTPSSS